MKPWLVYIRLFSYTVSFVIRTDILCFSVVEMSENPGEVEGAVLCDW